ncbi:uncharacterized protein EI97DRAFT_499074 [Westerdykella ornata]|uniref:RRM domain-containing protein n=1 Tax=Westerdykella ornata TaxID=318751 RepID=A0A6A6JU91_WESOR|nr:uncharacterized protein EI97DRAFT_499074 [Westerdykella ornata]KAF2279673.1 hypothetical protein EI97DRAFT_499074 [Westerdykella ornata]
MAPEDVKGKKRKGAVEAAPKPKKQKKSDDINAGAVEAPVKTKASRKKAEDFFDEDKPVQDKGVKEKKGKRKSEATTEVNGGLESVAKKPKKASRTKESADVEDKDAVAEEQSAVKASKVSKKGKKAKAQEKPKEPTPEAAPEEQHGESDEEEDDQTAALLAGFESDRDESDAEKEDEGLDAESLKEKVPKGLMKKLKDVNEEDSKPGVIFVGRIPHGFFESQMKAYFSQFGTVTRLRLSRNKKTGAPKHYAFVEFASSEVAEIVAKTMDKYLMFNHILQCKFIPPEQVHPNLFEGANRRYKKIPRNKMAGLQMVRGAERAVWEKRIDNENKRRTKKNKDLKEKLGYEYELPALKPVDAVPKKSDALEDGSGQKLIEAPAKTDADGEKSAVSEKAAPKSKDAKTEEPQTSAVGPKKTKKSKKQGEEPEPVKQGVKEKKRKSLTTSEVDGGKPKKAKKSKA